MERLPQQDGARGVAILLVLVWHDSYGQITPDAALALPAGASRAHPPMSLSGGARLRPPC
jgi:peptidoglycan/LPS O-acetylase OafA/YrhL